MTPSPQLIQQADRVLDTLMNQINGAAGAVICTADGFDIASRLEDRDSAPRFAAMASSITAIGGVVCEESRLGTQQNVMIEAANGYVVMVQIAHASGPLILKVVASKKAVLGQMAYFARQAALAMERSA